MADTRYEYRVFSIEDGVELELPHTVVSRSVSELGFIKLFKSHWPDAPKATVCIVKAGADVYIGSRKVARFERVPSSGKWR